ncbi:MAG: hypothetical protein NVS4B10_12900 [Myxococcales bacterium]
MPDTVRRVDYFYLEVADEPGSLAPVLARLKAARVNLLSFTAFPSRGGKSQIDLVPESGEALTEAARNAGLPLSEKKRAFFFQGSDRPGALAEIHRKLAEAKINVTAANGCVAPNGVFGMILWVKQDNFDAAARALGI